MLSEAARREAVAKGKAVQMMEVAGARDGGGDGEGVEEGTLESGG